MELGGVARPIFRGRGCDRGTQLLPPELRNRHPFDPTLLDHLDPFTTSTPLPPGPFASRAAANRGLTAPRVSPVRGGGVPWFLEPEPRNKIGGSELKGTAFGGVQPLL